MSASAPLRPPLPLAKRLNRNALTVAAVLMGITVLTAVVLVHPSREAHQTLAPDPVIDAAALVPSRPAFLDQPVRLPAVQSDSQAAVGLGLTDGGMAWGWGWAPGRSGSTRGGPRAAALGDAWRDLGLAVPADTTLPEPVPRRSHESEASSARRQAYHAALTSPTLVTPVTTPPTPAGVSVEPQGPSQASEEERLLGLGDSVLRAAARSATGGAGAGGVGREMGPTSQTAAGHHRAFLEQPREGKGSTVIARLDSAPSPFTLEAGTVIPGFLLTGINSDLPGDVVAQVSRGVYDSRTQRTLLIPKGARLIGTYDNRVVAGEDRLLVAWTRLILPDGRSMRLPGLALKDEAGQTGTKDLVDTHWQRVFGHALLLSAVGAGVQLSQPQQATAFTSPSAGQVAAGALGQELSGVALELLRRGMDAPPTIVIRQGQPFNVFLNGDLVFDGPYAETSPSER